jgi:hypothetical protein
VGTCPGEKNGDPRGPDGHVLCHVGAYATCSGLFVGFFLGAFLGGCLGVAERQRLGVVLSLFPVARADDSVWLLSVPSIPLIQAARRLDVMWLR